MFDDEELLYTVGSYGNKVYHMMFNDTVRSRVAKKQPVNFIQPRKYGNLFRKTLTLIFLLHLYEIFRESDI